MTRVFIPILFWGRSLILHWWCELLSILLLMLLLLLLLLLLLGSTKYQWSHIRLILRISISASNASNLTMYQVAISTWERLCTLDVFSKQRDSSFLSTILKLLKMAVIFLHRSLIWDAFKTLLHCHLSWAFNTSFWQFLRIMNWLLVNLWHLSIVLDELVILIELLLVLLTHLRLYDGSIVVLNVGLWHF